MLNFCCCFFSSGKKFYYWTGELTNKSPELISLYKGETSNATDFVRLQTWTGHIVFIASVGKIRELIWMFHLTPGREFGAKADPLTNT